MTNPLASPDSEPFWAGIARGELWLQRCADTGRLIFPPTPFSPFGDRRELGWERLSGRGRIWSFIVAHPPLTPYFEELAPYVSVLVGVEEDERVRVPGMLVAAGDATLGSVDLARVAIGRPVVIELIAFEPGAPIAPRWALAD